MPRDEFFQVLTRFGNVFPESSGSYLRIFRFAGGEKLAMCLASAVEITRKDQMETSVTIAVDVQSFQK